MSTAKDNLTTLEQPERLYYAPGVFLDAEDLLAEQTYHRGRLARVLDYLHGHGTVAGLKVVAPGEDDELHVLPGVAIDRLGRLVEVPRAACVNLGKWLLYHQQALQNPDEHEGEGRLLTSLNAARTELVADVFLRFEVCERGRTPAFATGPFDAVDASVPSRLRDGYNLSMVLRGGDSAGLPANTLPNRTEEEDFDAFSSRMEDYVLNAWHHGSANFRDGVLEHDASTLGTDDPASIFLARVRIPVTVDADGIPQRAPGTVEVDNHSRSFVYSSAAVFAWLRALGRPSRLS